MCVIWGLVSAFVLDESLTVVDNYKIIIRRRTEWNIRLFVKWLKTIR